MEGLHRHRNGSSITSLIKFKVNNKLTFNLLENKHITLGEQHLIIRPYINKEIRQCKNCYSFWHPTVKCKNKKVCVLCAGNCVVHACIAPNLKKCCNCGGSHPATFKNCPMIKKRTCEQFEASKSKHYITMVTENQNEINKMNSEINTKQVREIEERQVIKIKTNSNRAH